MKDSNVINISAETRCALDNPWDNNFNNNSYIRISIFHPLSYAMKSELIHYTYEWVVVINPHFHNGELDHS